MAIRSIINVVGQARTHAIMYIFVILLNALMIFGTVETGAKYVFKDGLGFSATVIALISLSIHVPWYLGAVLGNFQDKYWRHPKTRRNLLIAFATIIIGCDIVSGINHDSPWVICSSLFALNASGVAFTAMQMARMGVIAKSYGVSGRAGALMDAAPFASIALVDTLSGYTIQYYGFSQLCFLSIGVTVFAASAAIFCDHIFRELPLERKTNPVANTSDKMIGQKLAIPVAIIAFFWCFIPGWNTPLFFTLTTKWGLSQSQYEMTQAAEKLMILATTLVYMFICVRMRLRTLLQLGLGLGVTGCVGIMFAHSFGAALLACAWFGASCGIGNAALNDLIIRVSPYRREGYSVMFSFAAIFLAIDLSNIFGSVLFQFGGFALAMGITTLIPALLMPFVWRLSSGLADARDESIL